MKKKGVIYTCITGMYDELLNHSYIDPYWDYICFTDNLSIRNEHNFKWEIRKISFDKLDNVRNQRWHKLHPHVLFPEYENSIWVDGSIDICGKSVFNDVDTAINDTRPISIGPHPKRDCVYDEWDVCIKKGKDDELVMKRQIDLMKKKGFPSHVGLFETSIIYRKNHDLTIKKLMDEWWWWIKNYSRRDQLSFTYVLWQNNITITLLSDNPYRKNPEIRILVGKNHITKEEILAQAKKRRKGFKKINSSIRALSDSLRKKVSLFFVGSIRDKK